MNPDTLLAPLPGLSPCGEDLSFSAEFDAIAEARRADDPSLPQGEWLTALKVADWPAVRRACAGLLATRSKDLRVAGWLTEAGARLDGYAGLADGLALCRGLCERHWDGLHPRPDEDGDDGQRAGALRWLLAQVESLATALPVLRDGARAWSLRDIDAAAAGRAGDAAAAQDDLAAMRRATPAVAVAAALDGAERARQALAGLRAVVDARLGADAPAFAAAGRALDDAVQAIGRLVPGGAARGAARPAPALPSAGVADEVEAQGAGVPATATAPAADDIPVACAGAPRSRAEALRQLREVAAYFRRAEPHSPVAYLAERAARWGEMPLHDWLRAVVRDAGALSQVEELLGVDAPAPRAD